jgi:hypothetical protein
VRRILQGNKENFECLCHIAVLADELHAPAITIWCAIEALPLSPLRVEN